MLVIHFQGSGTNGTTIPKREYAEYHVGSIDDFDGEIGDDCPVDEKGEPIS